MDISSEKAAIHAMTRKEALEFYVAIVNSGDVEAIRQVLSSRCFNAA